MYLSVTNWGIVGMKLREVDLMSSLFLAIRWTVRREMGFCFYSKFSVALLWLLSEQTQSVQTIMSNQR